MKLLLGFIISLLSSLTPAKELGQDSFYFGVNSDYALPLVEVKSPLYMPELERGLLKDLGEAISHELKLKPVWVLLPKNRVGPSLLNNEISLICHLNEVWQPKIKDDVKWTHELYKSSNVVVFLDGKKPVQKIEDLYGERVGVVVNFIYQNLDKAFTKDLIHRENGPNNDGNIQKLLHGRINYVVMSNLEYDYYKKIYPTLESSDLGMDVVRTKCALSKNSKLSLEQVNRAIDTIKKNGTLDKILKSY